MVSIIPTTLASNNHRSWSVDLCHPQYFSLEGGRKKAKQEMDSKKKATHGLMPEMERKRKAKRDEEGKNTEGRDLQEADR